jgi:phosphomevalonate kinase
MPVRARAPGKLVVLGEYAVLTGAPALVFAVDRVCTATVDVSSEADCRLESGLAEWAERRFALGGPSGAALVDLIVAQAPGTVPAPWAGRLDSRAFFAGKRKLGLGSSAAAVCAFGAAWCRYTGQTGPDNELPALVRLIDWHRALQGGKGSGLDVAASYTGGAIRYQWSPGIGPTVSSVPVPKRVRFAGVFSGRSAATAGFIGRFENWRVDAPHAAAAQLLDLADLAEAGCAALAQGAVGEFLDVVDAYGGELASLGRAIGMDIVTAEHATIAAAARRLGVHYKVSGAGGGDLGIALSEDPDGLRALRAAVTAMGYRFVELDLEQEGLCIVEPACD